MKLRTWCERLFSYQEEGVRYLQTHPNALLADDMGLGKTVQALMALDGRPALVVCPPVAVGVWERECHAFRTDYEPLACHKLTRFPKRNELMILPSSQLPEHPMMTERRLAEQDAKRARFAPKPADTDWNKLLGRGRSITFEEAKNAPKKVKALSWEGVSRDSQLIFDEAHEYKNETAARTHDARVLAASFSRVWLLTGTPILSYASDLWNVLKLAGLERRAFGSKDNWRRLYGAYLSIVPGRHVSMCARGKCPGCVKTWKFPDNPPWELQNERVDAFFSVALRRMKREVLHDLPEEIVEYVKVPYKTDIGLSQVDTEEIDALTESIFPLSEDRVERIMASPSTPDFKTLSTIRAALAASRIEAAEAIVQQFEASDEPLVVFSVHRSIAEALGKRKGWASIAGDATRKRRDTFVEAFQAGRKRGIVATIGAAGVGITLTRAANVLFVDRDWTPALNRQAKDRVVRIGQTRGVRVMILVSDHPVDLLVEKVLMRKEKLEEATFTLTPGLSQARK